MRISRGTSAEWGSSLEEASRTKFHFLLHFLRVDPPGGRASAGLAWRATLDAIPLLHVPHSVHVCKAAPTPTSSAYSTPSIDPPLPSLHNGLPASNYMEMPRISRTSHFLDNSFLERSKILLRIPIARNFYSR